MLFEHCLYALFHLLLKLNFFYVNGELLNVRQDINKNNEDAYYDGDSQQFNNIQTSDCSIQCPPYWTEPVQQIQSLVYPAAAFVSLKCPYNGKPTPQLTWYKDDQVFVPKSYELSDLYSIDNYYLNISKATMYEKGIYKCMIENSLGNISRSFELRVQGRSFDRAVILSQTTNQTLYEGDNVTFECYFYSDSSPFVQWFIQRSIFQEFKFIKSAFKI
ncbi:unnamed protein product [Didymodactylos carnosus]|uniref:Ig-like domain-containing protein n=1 Tax=Didymodactylos carnosus TaxID=1234261 RepID=A0A8S2L6X4_9BILA|nr:unnamed protein product [Didymodactylos carnosus]CAF3876914.1 unnamed protein product [Didymodactylos carnosus]